MTALKTGLLAGAALLAGMTSASALTQTFSGSYGPATTNFTNQALTPTIAQFNPSLGTLTGITFSFTGTTNGSAKAESQDAAPTTVTETIGSSVTLILGGSTMLASVTPTGSVTHNFSAFDGSIDFSGTSGATDLNIGGTQSTTGTIASSNFAPFTGTGSVALGVSATGASSGTGAGNLITQFSTNASGAATVTYTYTAAAGPTPPTVPEPASLALLGTGLIGFGLLRRRRS